MHELSYELNVDDIAAFTLFHQGNSPSSRRGVTIARIAIPVLWLLVALVAPTPIQKGLWVLGALLWFALAPAFHRLAIARRVRKLYREGNQKPNLGPVRLVLTAEGLHEKTEHTEARYDSATLRQVALGKEHIYLYVGPISALVIPKSAFADESEMESFVREAEELVAQHTA